MKVNKRDDDRVLLTELLPYETPMFFSNEGFYKFCKSSYGSAPAVLRQILDRRARTIPYMFLIRKGESETRAIGLMHPAIQKCFVDFYSRHSYTILHLCGRSPCSLRHPASIGSGCIWPDELKEDDVRFSSTYFTYKKYPVLYRFFDSYEFLRLEKRFRHMLTFDISNCFGSIYTHSISWAVRRKSFAKNHTKHWTFDSEFDRLMQYANDIETAGVLVGPEVSRIFAEIILQRIDVNAIAQLKETDEELLPGRDFEVRRYVDDYFVFARDREIAARVKDVFRDELRLYHLSINAQKVVETTVPFMSEISCAKLQLGQVIDDFFSQPARNTDDARCEEPTTALQSRRWLAGGTRLIARIKMIVKTSGVAYSSVCSYLLGLAEWHTSRLLGAGVEPSGTPSAIPADFVLGLLDVVFFIYSMDVRTTTTDKVARVIRHVTKFADRSDRATAASLKKKVYDEVLRVLSIDSRRDSSLYMEAINLLPPLRLMGGEYRIPVKLLGELSEKLRPPSRDYEPIRYFLVVSLLFHIGDDTQVEYEAQKVAVMKHVIDYVRGTAEPFMRADCTCLFFDLLSCPFVDDQAKSKLLDAFTLEGEPLTASQRQDILNVVPNSTWFSNWSARDCVDRLLERRRLRVPY